MFGYLFGKSGGCTLYMVSKTYSKTELDALLGLTDTQMKALPECLSSQSGTWRIDTDRNFTSPQGMRYGRKYTPTLSVSGSPVILRNGELKGTLIFSADRARVAFLEFGEGEDMSSQHKYLQSDVGVPNVTATATPKVVV